MGVASDQTEEHPRTPEALMTQQTNPANDRRDNLARQEQVTDPITGITGVGPMVPATGRAGGHWGVAARWLAFAFLIIVAALMLWWAF